MKYLGLGGLIFFLVTCQSKQDDKVQSNENHVPKVSAMILEPKLIDEFYRTEQMSPDNPNLTFNKIAEINLHLNANEQPDKIELFKSSDVGSDPGDFHQIKITLDGKDIWTETNFSGWVRFNQNYTVSDSIIQLNQADTDLILATDFEATKIIGLFGWVYASEPGILTLIEFSSGKPRIMLNKQFDLVALNNKKVTVRFLEDNCWIQLLNDRIVMTCE